MFKFVISHVKYVRLLPGGLNNNNYHLQEWQWEQVNSNTSNRIYCDIETDVNLIELLSGNIWNRIHAKCFRNNKVVVHIIKCS